MPHTTHAYSFEAKVGGFADKMCEWFTTGGALRAFLLILDRNGNVTSLSFEDGSREWFDRAHATQRSETPHLFYDPLDDGMEYIWLSWNGVERSIMERLIGQPFEESDFLPISHFADRAGKLDPEKQFPQSWRVMF